MWVFIGTGVQGGGIGGCLHLLCTELGLRFPDTTGFFSVICEAWWDNLELAIFTGREVYVEALEV